MERQVMNIHTTGCVFSGMESNEWNPQEKNKRIGLVRKAVKSTSTIRICILRIVAAVAAVYGMYSFSCWII